MKVAVTVWAAFIVRVQVPVPEQPPPFQPAKVEGEVGLAVSITGVLSAKSKAQVEPQSMPAGELVMVPWPLFVTVRVCLPGRLNVAVTIFAAFMVTVQVPVPEQPSPLQPAKVDGEVALAVSVTGVFPAKA